MIEKNAKIYVAGASGLVGSAIVRNLQKNGYTNVVAKSHGELDLLDARAVEAFFETEKPEYVFDLLVQKIFDSWSFSAIAIGPTAILGTDRYNKFTCTSIFMNIRLKIGTSL